MPARMSAPPTPTPTPIPALAPVLRPPLDFPVAELLEEWAVLKEPDTEHGAAPGAVNNPPPAVMGTWAYFRCAPLTVVKVVVVVVVSLSDTEA